MKKILVFAMVLVSACMLFADTIGTVDSSPDELKLKVTVKEDSYSKWSNIKLEEAKGQNIDVIWQTGTVVETGIFHTKETIIKVYPSVLTNINSLVTMTVSGEALHADDVGETKIQLEAVGVDAEDAIDGKKSVSWAGTEEDEKNNTIVWTEDGDALKNGNRIISHELQISIDQDSYNEALASENYVATLKLAVTAN